MRKKLITLCLAALCVLGAQAKKVYADLSANQTIGKGTWNASTNTFSWTASTNARMLLTGLTGDLSEYTSLVLETSDYTATWRVDFIAGGDTIKEVEGTKFYQEGTKTIDLQKVFAGKTEKLKDVKEVRVNTNSNSGSIVINKAYLVKPMTSLDFNKEGIATVDFTDLVASGLTFDETTGEVKSESASSSTLSLSLPATGLDMSKVARIMMEYEDDNNIVDNLLMNDADGNKITQAYTSKYNLDYSKVANNTQPVAKMTWTIKNEGTMTIKAIKFYSKTFGEKYTLTVSDAGASTLVLPYAVKIPEGVKAYTLTYTSGTNVNATTLTGTIPANTPVLINAAVGDYEFTRTEGTDVPTLNSNLQTKDALIGQYMSGFTAPAGSYVLQKKTYGKLGFYKVAADNKQEILPFRAYLKIDATNTASMPSSLSINFDDEPFDGTTGISEVEKSEKVPNGRRYNLSGVEVSDQYKGIVIVDGKKYIIK